MVKNFEENKEIATTILKQLGGNRFVMMTGSKDFGVVENGLEMSLARNKTRANRLYITLNGSDLYDLCFEYFSFSKKTFEVKKEVIKKITDIYADQLQEIFTNITGLYTSL